MGRDLQKASYLAARPAVGSSFRALQVRKTALAIIRKLVEGVGGGVMFAGRIGTEGPEVVLGALLWGVDIFGWVEL